MGGRGRDVRGKEGTRKEGRGRGRRGKEGGKEKEGGERKRDGDAPLTQIPGSAPGWFQRRFVLQIAKSQRYRFSLLVNELRSDAGMASYLTSVLAFINCLIVSHDCINERVRIRNELIGKPLTNM